MDVAFVALVALSLVPPLLYALFIRSRERVDREPVRPVLMSFIWGGTLGVLVAILLHVVFEVGYTQVGGGFGFSAAFVGAVIAAPIVEELAKALGLRGIKGHLDELEDGIVYGAALGLGFAATENLFYGLDALGDGGYALAFGTVAVRVVSAMLLHGAASAILGYGYGKAVLGGTSILTMLPFYLIAVLLHASYNFLVGADIAFGLILAIILVAATMSFMRRKLEQLDRTAW